MRLVLFRIYNALRKLLGLPIVACQIIGCASVQTQPPGRFVVEVQWVATGDVYRDFPDVYDTMGDCLRALPEYVDADTLSVGCVSYGD